LNRETSVEELEDKEKAEDNSSDNVSPKLAKEGIPDRR
jgi:hypothetical protein